MRINLKYGLGYLLTAAALALPQRALAQSDFNLDTLIDVKPSGFQVDTLVGVIVNVITIVAGAIAIIYLVVSGISYITAGGNAEQATKARQGIINSLIGIAIIVLAFGLVKFVTTQLVNVR